MCKIQELSTDTKSYKPKYEMQDIFKLYGDDYISRHKLNSMQLKAIRNISVCRTSAMGYNTKECNDCKNIEFTPQGHFFQGAYNSCRNRNCLKCQGDEMPLRVQAISLDRLLHHSRVINILGDSYRLKEKKEEGLVDSGLYNFQATKSVKGAK